MYRNQGRLTSNGWRKHQYATGRAAAPFRGEGMERSRLLLACALPAFLILPVLPCLAQTPQDPIEELKVQLRRAQETLQQQQALIESLQKRLDELEKKDKAAVKPQEPALRASAQAPASPSPVSVSWKDGQTTFKFPGAQINVSNRLQYRWTDDHFQDPEKVDQGAFTVRRFKTSVYGWAYTKDLTYRLQVDWANANTSLGILDDAWIQYDFTHGKGLFQLRAGQMKTPFGRQSIAATKANQFVDRSFVSYQFCAIRDVGVMATGQFGTSSVKDMFEYSFGLFNGGGRSVYTNPDNKYQRDFRFVFSPWGSAGYDEANPYGAPKPKLSVGFDYEHNDRRIPAQHGAPASGAMHHAVGYDLLFKYKWLTAYGEYFGRRSFDAKGLLTASNGLNAQVGLLVIPKRLELFAGRWSYDPDDERFTDRQTETGIGANWYFSGFNSKLQADCRKIEDAASRYHTYEFRLQYQFVF